MTKEIENYLTNLDEKNKGDYAKLFASKRKEALIRRIKEGRVDFSTTNAAQFYTRVKYHAEAAKFYGIKLTVNGISYAGGNILGFMLLAAENANLNIVED